MHTPLAMWNTNRDCWESTGQTGLLSELLDVYSGIFPTSGMTRGGLVFALPTSEHPTTGSASSFLLRTPTSQLAVNGGSQHPDKRKAGGHGPTLADEVEHLLPTPNSAKAASDMDLQKSGDGREKPNKLGWAIALLPTPSSTNASGNEYNNRGDLLLPRVARTLLPTPTAQASGNSPEDHLRKKPGRSVVTDLAILTENDLLSSGGRMGRQFADGNTLWDD